MLRRIDMTIGFFEGIGHLSLIVTILVIVGIGCYLWYLAVEHWQKEDEEYNNYITQSTKPPIEEPPKPQTHEHEVNSEYVQIQEKQPPPSYSLEQPYYHIRERFTASSPKPKEEPKFEYKPSTFKYEPSTFKYEPSTFEYTPSEYGYRKHSYEPKEEPPKPPIPKPKEEPPKPQAKTPNPYIWRSTEDEEEPRNYKPKQTLIIPPSPPPIEKKAYIPPPPPPPTLYYTVNLTNKRNLTDNKVCLLLIDQIGKETIEKMQQGTTINVKGIKIYTKQLKHGYKTKETQTVLTLTTTPTKLLEIAKSDEAKTYERNKMTSTLRQKIMIRDNYTCQMCGKVMRDTVGLQIDHIVPINKGGKTEESNLQVLCSICNGRKSDKILGG